jgi:formylglycine-generating enzyme required for sulfatase activity
VFGPDPLRPPVGSFPPNKFGLYDLVGNVSEIVEDLHEDGYTVAIVRGSHCESGVRNYRESLLSGYREELTGTGDEGSYGRVMYGVTSGNFLNDKMRQAGFRVVIASANQPPNESFSGNRHEND